MPQTVTLHRPVGQKEYDLIKASDWKKFPPRLFFQPIFYPVVEESYAIQIAKDWNTKDPVSGYAGYVTRFQVDATYLSKFDLKQVGGKSHTEYWIPADSLEEFNNHIVGLIQIIHRFAPKKEPSQN